MASKLEEEMLKQIAQAHLLDGMVREFRFHSTRRWRWDFAWPEKKLALEVQGGVFTRGRHSRPRGMMNDYEKISEGTILGWRPILVTAVEIRNGAAIDRLERAMQWPVCGCGRSSGSLQ